MSDKTLTPPNLSAVGLKLIQNCSAVISETIFWGAYCILVVIALRSLGVFTPSRHKELTPARLWIVTTTIIMFLMSTVLWALDFATAIQQMRIELVSTADTFKSRGSLFSEMMNTRYFAQTVLFTAEIILGDAVVVWRACVLWDWNKILVSVAGFLLFSAFVLLTFFVGCIGHTGWHFANHESPICDRSQLATYAVSVAVNAWATAWITYMAWKFYRFGADSGLPASKKGSRGYRTLFLIVESGWIYLLIWLSKSFTYLPVTGSPKFAAGILNSIGNQIAGLYPTILITVVHQQRVSWGSPDYSHNINIAISTPSFVRNDIESRVAFAPGPSPKDTPAEERGENSANTSSITLS